MGWIVCGILLVLLAMMPVRLLIAYSLQSISVKLKIGFITFDVLPRKAKKQRKMAEKVNTAPSSEGAEPAKKQKSNFRDYLPLLRLVLDLFARLRRKAVVRQLNFVLILAGDDPSDLAVQYGRAQGVFAALLAQIENAFCVRNRNVRIECDFTADKTVLDGFVDLSISFGRLLLFAAKYGTLIFREYFAILNQKKAVQ